MPSHFPATVLKLKTGMAFHDCSSLRDIPPQLVIMQSAAAKMHGNDIAVGRIIRDAIYRMDTTPDSLFIREEIIRSSDRASFSQGYSKEP